ncbi:S41 family peptidase [Pedobacter borealis]|uniref:S41 family peptidase n=1 Tax=Pedobacter borealis TaxID=475254 RepID=UPI000A64CE07|nr:S41 family peptidase [Pedobacter borealis]
MLINTVRNQRLIIFLLLSSISFSVLAQAPSISRKETNIKAFASLYGYVRFFHPSDFSKNADWIRLAAYGAGSVLEAKDDDELLIRLKEIFSDFLPYISITKETSNKSALLSKLTPSNISNYRITRYKNFGLGLPYGSKVYKSLRSKIDSAENDFDSYPLVKGLDIQQFKNSKFILSFEAEGDSTLCDINSLEIGMTSNKKIVTKHKSETFQGKKQKITFEGQFDESSNILALDLRIYTRSLFKIDNIKLTIFKGSKPQIIDLKTALQVNNSPDLNFHLNLVETNKNNINSKSDNEISFIATNLTENIKCLVPKALYSTSTYTYPKQDTFLINNFNAKIKTTLRKDPNYDLNIRLGSSVIIWNVLKYAYPYWDDANISQDSLLHYLFTRSLIDRNAKEFYTSLLVMSSKINDGHMFISYSGLDRDIEKGLPLDLIKIGDKILIKNVLDSSLSKLIKKGSVIDSINGKPALITYNKKYNLISGSPQWRNFKTLLNLFNGKITDSVTLSLSDNSTPKLKLPLFSDPVEYRSFASQSFVPKNGLISKGIYYFNLSAPVLKEIESNMQNLLSAKAIIFDMRGYPVEDVRDVLRHLIKCSENNKWMKTPIIDDPFEKNYNFKTSGWNLSPKTPYLASKIIFLSDACAQSYAESILGYVKGMKLGTIIGQRSSGTNGDIQTIQLQQDTRVFYTGTKVLNLDGSKHHVSGIIPDIVVSPTISAIREGRDEVFEKALLLAQ